MDYFSDDEDKSAPVPPPPFHITKHEMNKSASDVEVISPKSAGNVAGVG